MSITPPNSFRNLLVSGNPAAVGDRRGGAGADASASDTQPNARSFARATDRRGPFRPLSLISTRKRLRGESITRTVRILDACATIALAWLTFDLVAPLGVWSSPVAQVAPVFAAAFLLMQGLEGAGAYRFGARETLSRHLIKVAGAFVATGGLLGATLWAAHAPTLITGVLGVWLGLTAAVTGSSHLAWWTAVRRMRREGRLTPTMVIVGANKTAEKLIAKALEHRDVAVLGVFDDRLGRAPGDIAGVPVLGDVNDLINHRIMPYVDQVVITVASTAQNRIRELTERLKTLPNEVTLLIDAKDGSDAAAISRLADMPLAKVSGSRLDPDRAFAKRVQDVVLGGILLVIAAPVMVAVALAIKLDSPGPVLFRQRRQGFNNEAIIVWKFRSMKHETDQGGPVQQVCAGDTRVTRLGRFIRRTSLDELPQLWNVLRGEMSLVGPRPHEPSMKTGAVQSSRLIADYAHRHRMKPGMTGWAAIHGSRGPLHTPAQVRARVMFDIEYIERQSFWLDVYIMLKTLPCLLGDARAAR